MYLEFYSVKEIKLRPALSFFVLKYPFQKRKKDNYVWLIVK